MSLWHVLSTTARTTWTDNIEEKWIVSNKITPPPPKKKSNNLQAVAQKSSYQKKNYKIVLNFIK